MEHSRLSRRGFLATSGGAAVVVLGVASAPAWGEPTLRSNPFTLGIASGDPAPDGFVLWTRLAPDPLAPDGLGGMPSRPVPVHWQVAKDPRFQKVVRDGVAHAVPEHAHTVHVELEGLDSDREYFYRFRAGKEMTSTGRARTAPSRGSSVDSVRLALAACQKWVGGPYASYRNMAEEDLDLVVHVGDYIYEAKETTTLTDYRLIYAQYKQSPDLQAAHARFPFVVTLDDHEVENDWGAEFSKPDDEPGNDPASFLRQRAAAFQAYWEHQPLRRAQRPKGSAMRLHRRIGWGRLASLQVLDTRQYRTGPNVSYDFPYGPRRDESLDPARSITGGEQEQWMYDGMASSNAEWNVLAQQTIMAHYDYDLGDGVAVNHDQWDGYVASRERLLNFIDRARPKNPITLTGDWHCSLVNDINRGDETLATEFVATSISSSCRWAPDVEAAVPGNPHTKYFEGDHRGYVSCTVTSDEWRSDYRGVVAPDDTTSPAMTLSSWVVESGKPGAEPA